MNDFYICVEFELNELLRMSFLLWSSLLLPLSNMVFIFVLVLYIFFSFIVYVFELYSYACHTKTHTAAVAVLVCTNEFRISRFGTERFVHSTLSLFGRTDFDILYFQQHLI